MQTDLQRSPESSAEQFGQNEDGSRLGTAGKVTISIGDGAGVKGRGELIVSFSSIGLEETKAPRLVPRVLRFGLHLDRVGPDVIRVNSRQIQSEVLLSNQGAVPKW